MAPPVPPRKRPVQSISKAAPAVRGGEVRAGYLRVGPVMAIPAVLGEFGIDASALLGPFGLAPEYFDNPENTLPSRTLGRIFGQSAARTGCEHFGLLVGERAGMQSLGAVGYLMQSAPSVGAALDLLARNMRVHDRGGVALVERRDGYAALGYAVVDREVEEADQMMAGALAIVMNVLRGLCGAHWRPAEVRFAFAAPRNAGPYRKFFGLTPSFNAQSSLMLFTDDWLSRPLASADPLLHVLMQERVREQLERGADDLSSQLRRFLRADVSGGRVSLDSAARYFGVHSRAFRRQLESEGSSFRRIRNEVQFDAACQMLRYTRATAGEIASILGFADASAFTRAFARQASVSPARWRAANARSSAVPSD